MDGRVAGNRCPQWSELQLDLLELILEKLDLVAHARFASVCSSWRSAAVENPPINKHLYFALSHDPENLVRRFITSFIPQRSWKEALFVGAGLDGWLVILIDRKDLFLVNKAFNSIIPLPHPPDPKYFFQRPEFCKAVLSSPPSSSTSGECTVVLSRPYGGDLFYCRPPSDKSFSKLSDTSFRGLDDILFYKGQLYVLCFSDIIIVFDHLLNKVTQFVTHLGDIIRDDFRTHLLISENKLLIIGGRKPLVFKVEQSESRVIRVNNINDNLLLLTRFYSVSTTADMHKEFRRNFDRSSLNYRPIQTTESGIAFLEMPYVTNDCDTWPLFFFMFDQFGIENVVSNEP